MWWRPMWLRVAGPDTVAPHLAEYVAEHWDSLLAEADEIADEHVDRSEVVLDALTRVARGRAPADDADLDRRIRRQITGAAARRLRRSEASPRGPADDLADIDVVEVAPWAAAGGWDTGTPDGEADGARSDADSAATAPATPDPDALDPVEALRARVRRARRRRTVELAAGAAVLVVAVVLVATGAGEGGSGPAGTNRAGPAGANHIGGQRAGTNHGRMADPNGSTDPNGGTQSMGAASQNPVELPSSPEARPTGVAAGGGHLWTLELHPSGRRPNTTVVERDLGTGRREASYQVPGEDFGISYALGRVWVWGVESGIRNASVVTALDPVSGARWTKAVDTDVIEAAGFTAHRAWFTEDGLSRVVAVTPAGHAEALRLRLSDASHVAATGPGSVVVSGDSDIMQLLPTGRPALAENAPPTLLASSRGYAVWIGEGADLFYRPHVAAPSTLHLRLPLRVALVVGDPTRGVYVATSSNDPQHFDPYLVYYSPRDLRAAHPQPSARLDGRVRVESMAPAPRGGLVFVTTDGQIEGWDPAVVTVSPGSDHVDHALG